MAVPQEELMKMIAAQRDKATPGGMVGGPWPIPCY